MALGHPAASRVFDWERPGVWPRNVSDVGISRPICNQAATSPDDSRSEMYLADDKGCALKTLVISDLRRWFVTDVILRRNHRGHGMSLRRLSHQIASLRVMLKALRLSRRYHPDQPRAPAGRPDGGRWVDWDRARDVAGPYNEANRVKCELQYDSDMFQCSFVRDPVSRHFCGESARSRHTACMKDFPMPDLIYYVGVKQ